MTTRTELKSNRKPNNSKSESNSEKLSIYKRLL